ncbi:MAG: AzlD domain-containing protein [Gammaproteobacteria bacterium]|nr:AzlD domain-containing protein [Gammaproteobacteria bacterium]MBU1414040.1 AzlD domain-containing protein [Gammaproteobacteria bacterium]
MNLWWIFVASGLLTFAIRLSFIALSGRYRPPSWFVVMLPFVPITALTALIVPELLLVAGQISIGFDNPRFWAGLVAIGVAAWKRNVLLTIGCGFAALWVMQVLR